MCPSQNAWKWVPLLLSLLMQCAEPNAAFLRMELRHQGMDFGSRAHHLRQPLTRAAGLSSLTGNNIQPIGSDMEMNLQADLMSGQGVGHVVDIYLGTPPVKLCLIVDTGSNLVWTQCKPCRSCYEQLHPIFDPLSSSSYSTITCGHKYCNWLPHRRLACARDDPSPCSYGLGYADSSYTLGNLARETVALKSRSSKPTDVRIPGIAFGCGSLNQGSFSHSDGVLGLGQGPLSFPNQIAHTYGTKFAYCLVDSSDSTSQKSLLLFGKDSDKLVSRLQYTSIIENRAAPVQYYVRIVNITVGGNKPLPIRDEAFRIQAGGYGGTFFDSGTTFTRFLDEIYDEVYKAYDAALPFPRARVPADYHLSLCFKRRHYLQHMKGKPSLSIGFKDGSVFTPPLRNIFVDVGNGVSCLAIVRGDTANILGNIFQENFLIVYEPGKARIGFAQTNCANL